MTARFLHTADWQLGMKGGRLGDAAETVTGARVRTVRRLLEVARERGIETVLACGDLFEHDKVADALVEDVAAVLADFPDVEIHAIPGNHDPSGPGSVWRRGPLVRLENLRLHDRAYDGARLEIAEGLFLHAFPVTSRYDNVEPLAALPDVRAMGGVHVAMAHGHLTTETFGGHEDDVTLPLDPRQVERSGIDYLALGHWHGLRLVDIAGAPRIAYSGTHEPTRFQETDPGQVLIVDIAEKGAPPRIEPVHVAEYQWGRLACRLEDDDDVIELENALHDHDADLLEVRLEGVLDGAAAERVEAALELAGRGRPYLDVRNDVVLRAEAEGAIADPLLVEAIAAVDGCGAEAAVRARAGRFLRDWAREEAS